MALSLDWNAIRPLNGARSSGFEELCSQLARAESPAGAYYERKGAPDAGVECYAVLCDGSEWGWQAKYFDGLGKSQWQQLDKSVKTAIEKHPRLVRYYVCIPLDRSDARINGQKSAKEQWDDHVRKWNKWAADRNMSVEFVYWGSFELLDRLGHPEHVGRLRFWFDVHGFDGAWFQARLDEALKTAGPRYTPEVNVGLPIASELEMFGRTERFFDRIKTHARGIRDKLRMFGYSESKVVDPSLDASVSALSTKVQTVLTELGTVKAQPVGALPFQKIADQIAVTQAAVEELEGLFIKRDRAHDAEPSETKEKTVSSARGDDSLKEGRYRLHALNSELRRTREALEHAQAVAGSALMLLKGVAGTGKTHLLCDIARHRVATGQPTVLLMGQRFVSSDTPWTQVLQQLDLSDLSAEEFVGALESAAQAAAGRALVLVDAINEGSGRLIWPSHLAAFLAHLERSPWIGVLLSVRTSYEEIVVTEEIRNRAVHVTHDGFAGNEYDATRTFFVYYGLELPSTPLLAPEFRNPLFLKTLCCCLNKKGESRLPRGFHGITAVFDLYLSAINDRLASDLGFNSKSGLLRLALEAVSKVLIGSGQRWLPLAKAEEVVNALLPGREFQRSLYHGLVMEGVLIEEAIWQEGETIEEVVFIAYDRFADHLITKQLLDAHLDMSAPAAAFAAQGPLAFIWDESQYVAAGLLEAMCIQIPERTGQELVTLAPKLIEHYGMGEAFRQSLVWRAFTAYSNGTREVLNSLTQSDRDVDDTLDVLLTVSTLSEHPLNARFLDKRLRRDSMPDRDVWWSTYLHRAWGNNGAVDRLVDWASALASATLLDEDTVDLSATVLSWMFSTSNRFLRDRATKALVRLLTGRLDAVGRLIEWFTDVDDLYIAERVYAVAYGTAMRSNDVAEVGALAAKIYTCVFRGGNPPAHILLRDYARGVVERAIYLGADLSINEALVRPPYASCWPPIPSEDDIKPLLPDWSRGSHDSRDLEWSRNRIGSSVMDDDFAYYVIGTNSWHTDWLSLRLEEPKWQSLNERLSTLFKELSEGERTAWESFKAATDALSNICLLKKTRAICGADEGKEPDNGGTIEATNSERQDHELAAVEQERGAALSRLKSALTEEHNGAIEPLINMMNDGEGGRRPPPFDLRQIQRYILWRVFDLGWTTKRFGYFDRFLIGYHGREAAKAERIGKKYQWIAYHEIMALVADHFQYRERFSDQNGDQAYVGPWQDHLRNIDPSCTLRSRYGGISWNGHTPAWWGSAKYDNWDNPIDPQEWVTRYDDLPKVDNLLVVTCPDDGVRWLNVQGYFNWRQPTPADLEATDVERRELWYICTGYLIRMQDADAFMKWAEDVDFWGHWMPEPPVHYRMFLGEHCWSPASEYFQKPYFGDDGWVRPNHGCPVKLRSISLGYLKEAGSFDCSVDESYTLKLPASELIAGLGLNWSGNNADYLDAEGKLAAFDPTACADGPNALLLREDLLKEFLAHEKLTICWTILGEKRVIGAGFTPTRHASCRMSGAYRLGDNGSLSGFLIPKADSS